MTPQPSLCVLSQYQPPWVQRPCPAGKGAQGPGAGLGDGPLTDVTPRSGPRIHGYDHSVLELEGQGGGAMGHVNLHAALSVPAQGLQELGGLVGRRGRERGNGHSRRGLLQGRAGGHPGEEVQRFPNSPPLQGNGWGREGGGARTGLFRPSAQQKRKEINVATVKLLGVTSMVFHE